MVAVIMATISGFAERLIELRENKGKKRQEVADDINISRASLEYYEKGKRFITIFHCKLPLNTASKNSISRLIIVYNSRKTLINQSRLIPFLLHLAISFSGQIET